MKIKRWLGTVKEKLGKRMDENRRWGEMQEVVPYLWESLTTPFFAGGAFRKEKWRKERRCIGAENVA